MNITRTAAIAVFAALGFKTADKWNTARLNEKVAKIADNVTDKEVEAIEDKDIKSTVMDIIDDLKAGKTVTVTEDTPAKEEPKAEAPAKTEEKAPAKEEKPAKSEKPAKEEKPSKSDKPAKADKKDKPASKKEEPAKDKVGNRIGSQAADINAAIGKGWTTEEEVCKATKLKPARVQNHFRYLEGRKLIETDEKKGVRWK